MSERGSVSSQYFYCNKCCLAAFAVFEDYYEYPVKSVVVRPQDEADKLGIAAEYPIIIAAKTHCSYPGEEIDEFENDVAPELAKVLCHQARFAILCDSEERGGIAVVTPLSLLSDDAPSEVAWANLTVPMGYQMASKN